MNQGRLSAGTRWLDQNTLAGGLPYGVFRLTQSGAQTIRDFLTEGGNRALTTNQADLIARLIANAMLLPPPSNLYTLAEVTVVIPALSAPEPVQHILTFLPAEVKIVVVDDGSIKNLSDVLVPQNNLTVLRNDVSRGPATARNIGAAMGNTTWLLFLDADVEPSPSLIEELLRFVSRSEVVAIAPRVVSRPGVGLASWFEGFSALDMGEISGMVGHGHAIPYVPSACLLVRTEMFQALKGFNEELHVGEDVDFVWRLTEYGQIQYESSIKVIHQPRTSIFRALQRRHFYGTSAALLSRQHSGRVTHLEISVWTLVPWLASLFLSVGIGCLLIALSIFASPLRFRGMTRKHARQLAISEQRSGIVNAGRWLVRPFLPVTIIIAILLPYLKERLAVAVLLGFVGVFNFSIRKKHSTEIFSSLIHSSQRVLATLLNDVSYSLGVWQGVIRHRRLHPVLPRVLGLRRTSRAQKL